MKKKTGYFSLTMSRATCQASFTRSSGAKDSQSSSHSSAVLLGEASSWFNADDKNVAKGVSNSIVTEASTAVLFSSPDMTVPMFS